MDYLQIPNQTKDLDLGRCRYASTKRHGWIHDVDMEGPLTKHQGCLSPSRTPTDSKLMRGFTLLR